MHARRSWLGLEGGGGDVSILSFSELRAIMRACSAGTQGGRRDTFLGCDPDRHYNRASARLCYPGTTEAGRVGGRGNVRICANCSRNPNIRMRMHDSKPVRLLITLYGSRHLSVHDAHAPATRLRRAARVHELTIAAGSDSSSTFGVGAPGGAAPTDAKRVPQCHPESVRLRRPPAAKRLATGSLDRKIGDRLAGCRRDPARGRRRAPSAMS